MSVGYFLDEATEYEVMALLQVMEYATKTQWETMRANMYVVAQTQSTKKLTPQDIMVLPWEKVEKQKEQEISTEEVNRMKAKTEKMRELLIASKGKRKSVDMNKLLMIRHRHYECKEKGRSRT